MVNPNKSRTSVKEQKTQRKFKEAVKIAHLNHHGGLAWNINDPLVQLRIAASASFFGEPMYYQPKTESKAEMTQSGLESIVPPEWYQMTPTQLMESAIDRALDKDIELTLHEAVRLRNDAYMRTTPQVILVRAAHHEKQRGTGFVRDFAKDIMIRGDEPAVCLAYHYFRYGDKPIPNCLKKAMRTKLESLDEYSLAKYRQEKRKVKMVDVMNLVHPKSEAINKLANSELKQTGETWEAIISAKGSTKEAWTKSIGHMGHMALLRNLRNLIEKGVDPKLFLGKLTDGVKKGKQFPFRYFSAFREIESIATASVLDALEICMQKSLKNMPQFPGKVLVISDNSGSMGNTISDRSKVQMQDIANLMGIIAAHAYDEGELCAFSQDYQFMPIRKIGSIFDQKHKADQLVAGYSTELYKPIQHIIDGRLKYDSIIIMTDMQVDFVRGGRSSYHSGCSAKLIGDYRNRVNPDVMVFAVNLAAYHGSMFPEFYDRTFLTSGWNDQIFKFMQEMYKLYEQKPEKSSDMD